MAQLLNSKKYYMYGKEYKLNFVSESLGTNLCCYEIYDSDDNYIGSAGNMDEAYSIIKDSIAK